MKKQNLKTALTQSEPHKAISKLVEQKEYSEWSKPDLLSQRICNIGNVYEAIYVECNGNLSVKFGYIKIIERKGVTLDQATQIINKWIEGFKPIKNNGKNN